MLPTTNEHFVQGLCYKLGSLKDPRGEISIFLSLFCRLEAHFGYMYTNCADPVQTPQTLLIGVYTAHRSYYAAKCNKNEHTPGAYIREMSSYINKRAQDGPHLRVSLFKLYVVEIQLALTNKTSGKTCHARFYAFEASGSEEENFNSFLCISMVQTQDALGRII